MSRSISTPWLRLAGLTLLAFGIGMATNTLDPAVLSAKVNQLAPDRPNTALGFTTAAGLLVATLTQPLIGALSDRADSAWGRRVPFIVLGALFAAASLFGLALASSITLLVLGMLAYEFAANVAQAPWQALLPDQVPEQMRGVASGLKTVFEILAFVAGRRTSGYLVAEGELINAVAVAAVVFVLAMVITAVTAREPARTAGTRTASSAGEPARAQSAADSLDPPPRSQAGTVARTASDGSTRSSDRRSPWPPGFVWWFVNRGLFWGAAIGLNNFVLFYLRDVIGMSFAEAARFFGDLSLVLGLSLVAVTIPAGRLSDRIGRRPLILGASAVAIGGNLALLFARSRPMLVVAGGSIGVAVGIYLAANWALATELVPRFRAARYLGIANIATAGGSFAARFAGGALIDPINRLTGDPTAGYTALYSLTLLAFLVAGLAVLRLPSSSLPSPEPSSS